MKEIIKKWLDIKTKDVQATSHTFFDLELPVNGETQFDINSMVDDRLKTLRTKVQEQNKALKLILKELKVKLITVPGVCTDDEDKLVSNEEYEAMNGDYTKPLKKSKK